MPPANPEGDSVDPPAPSSSDAMVEERTIRDSAALRKLLPHPSTAVMVKEAFEELDSRKGVSSQAIQGYIKQKYPSVDAVKLKHLVRKVLRKGIEDGTLVRPHNSTNTTGAQGKFKLAAIKKAKPKTENMDPNVQKAPEPAKDGAKKPKKTGATKKDSTKEQTNAQEDSKPPKKSKKAEGSATTKSAPAKKPKAKMAAAEKVGEESPDSAKPKGDGKAASATKTKAAKASKSKAAKAGSDAPASKATGKRGKKTAE